MDKINEHIVNGDPLIGSAILATASAILEFAENEGVEQPIDYTPRQVIHKGGWQHALKVADDFLRGSHQRFNHLFRVDKDTFHRLCDWIDQNAPLPPSRYQTLQQKVMIFLWICGHGETQRNAANLFKISQSSVSETMQLLLEPMRQLHVAFVKLPDEDFVSPEVELDPRSNTFNGCIGALDGTHIAAHIPSRHQQRFYDRKGRVSQNVLAAVTMNGMFSFVLAGGEGRLHDASLLRMAFGHGLTIPPGRFYLADAGFGLNENILVPYPNVRYHLDDWYQASRRPENQEELYNLRHARLRIIVEQTFGRVKRKFKIIRNNPAEYSFKDQVRIIFAVTGLWNFIHTEAVPEFSAGERAVLERARMRADWTIPGLDGRALRDRIAERNWQAYQEYLQNILDEPFGDIQQQNVEADEGYEE